MPKISIIIPVYNTEKYLNRCIDSILNQSFRDFEIILVDDGSTDRSPKICDDYEKIDSRVKVVHKSNGGVSCARNIGIDMATADYISFIDSDDSIESVMYEELYNLYKEDVDLTACSYEFVFDNVKNFKKTNANNEVIDMATALHYSLINRDFYGYIFNKLYKKEIIDKFNFKFDENISYGEDTLWLCKYVMKCRKIAFINENYYYYYINPDSAMAKPFSTKKLTMLYSTLELIEMFDNKYAQIDEALIFKLASFVLNYISAIYYSNGCHDDSINEIKRISKENYRKILNNKIIAFKTKLIISVFLINSTMIKSFYKIRKKIKKINL